MFAMRSVANADFVGMPTSVGAARAMVRRSLIGLSESTLDRAVLLTSELATNAIRHAGTRFRLTVTRSNEFVRIEVVDTGQGRPVRRDPRPGDISGRGLLIVEMLADAWGFRQDGDAKSVWAQVHLLEQPEAGYRQGASG